MDQPSPKTLLIVVAWIVAIGLSFLGDRFVANTAVANKLPQQLKADYILYHGNAKSEHRIGISAGDVLKWPGEYWMTAVLAVGAMLMTRPREWQAGAFVLLCGTLSGVNGLIKWIAGRARPFKALNSKLDMPLEPFHFQPFYHGVSGLFGTTNLCFPSGHAALAFANAAGMAILFPRWRWLWYALATLCAAERFLETAHFFSDTVAAAALGIGGAHLLAWLLRSRAEDNRPQVQDEPGTSP